MVEHLHRILHFSAFNQAAGLDRSESSRALAFRVRRRAMAELATGALGALLPKIFPLLQDAFKLRRSVKVEIVELAKELESMRAAAQAMQDVPPEELSARATSFGPVTWSSLLTVCRTSSRTFCSTPREVQILPTRTAA